MSLWRSVPFKLTQDFHIRAPSRAVLTSLAFRYFVAGLILCYSIVGFYNATVVLECFCWSTHRERVCKRHTIYTTHNFYLLSQKQFLKVTLVCVFYTYRLWHNHSERVHNVTASANFHVLGYELLCKASEPKASPLRGDRRGLPALSPPVPL